MVIHTARFGKVSSHMNGQVSATCTTPITKTVQQSAENDTLSSMCPGTPLGHSSLQWVATSDHTYTCRTRGQVCGRTPLWTNMAGHLSTVSGHSEATGRTEKPCVQIWSDMWVTRVGHVSTICPARSGKWMIAYISSHSTQLPFHTRAVIA